MPKGEAGAHASFYGEAARPGGRPDVELEARTAWCETELHSEMFEIVA